MPQGLWLPSGKAIENHHFDWENSLWTAIFNSYLKLPEGTLLYWVLAGILFRKIKNHETLGVKVLLWEVSEKQSNMMCDLQCNEWLSNIAGDTYTYNIYIYIYICCIYIYIHMHIHLSPDMYIQMYIYIYIHTPCNVLYLHCSTHTASTSLVIYGLICRW